MSILFYDINYIVVKFIPLLYRYDVIFNTGGLPLDEYKLRRQLLPYGSYVSTVPEHLTSDSLGFIFGSVFSSYVRLRLAIQVITIICERNRIIYVRYTYQLIFAFRRYSDGTFTSGRKVPRYMASICKRSAIWSKLISFRLSLTEYLHRTMSIRLYTMSWIKMHLAVPLSSFNDTP